MKAILVFLSIIFFSTGILYSQDSIYTIEELLFDKDYKKVEILQFQTDDVLVKANIENFFVTRKWINDTLFCERNFNGYYDTFFYSSDQCFVRIINSKFLYLFTNSGDDSFMHRNEIFNAPVKLIDSFDIDRKEKIYIIRMYYDYGNVAIDQPTEIEYFYSKTDGILGYLKPTSTWVIRDVKRIVGIETYIKGKKRPVRRYYNFEIPKSWKFDLFKH